MPYINSINLNDIRSLSGLNGLNLGNGIDFVITAKGGRKFSINGGKAFSLDKLIRTVAKLSTKSRPEDTEAAVALIKNLKQHLETYGDSSVKHRAEYGTKREKFGAKMYGIRQTFRTKAQKDAKSLQRSADVGNIEQYKKLINLNEIKSLSSLNGLKFGNGIDFVLTAKGRRKFSINGGKAFSLDSLIRTVAKLSTRSMPEDTDAALTLIKQLKQHLDTYDESESAEGTKRSKIGDKMYGIRKTFRSKALQHAKGLQRDANIANIEQAVQDESKKLLDMNVENSSKVTRGSSLAVKMEVFNGKLTKKLPTTNLDPEVAKKHMFINVYSTGQHQLTHSEQLHGYQKYAEELRTAFGEMRKNGVNVPVLQIPKGVLVDEYVWALENVLTEGYKFSKIVITGDVQTSGAFFGIQANFPYDDRLTFVMANHQAIVKAAHDSGLKAGVLY